MKKRVKSYKDYKNEVDLKNLEDEKSKFNVSVDGSNLATKFKQVHNPLTNQIEEITIDDINDKIAAKKDETESKNESSINEHTGDTICIDLSCFREKLTEDGWECIDTDSPVNAFQPTLDIAKIIELLKQCEVK